MNASSRYSIRVNRLSVAVGDSGLARPLKEGTVATGRLKLDFIPVNPIIAAFRRMVRGLEFDVCEMALTTYICALAYGKPMTAIPVFLTRNFHHWAIFYNVKSGIKEPKDLEGRVAGVNRGYTVTTGLWARGMLETEYGVDLNKITWAPTNDEHVAEFQAPSNVDYSFRGKPIVELLLSGQIDAAIGDIKVDAPEIRPLIPDAREAGFAYFRKTGVYPINHAIVIKNSILEAEPWVAEELFRIFKAAKEAYLAHLTDREIIERSRVVGDPFPFGIRSNQKTLDAMVRFAVGQRVIPRKLEIEELFARQTLDLE